MSITISEDNTHIRITNASHVDRFSDKPDKQAIKAIHDLHFHHIRRKRDATIFKNSRRDQKQVVSEFK